MIGRPFDKVMAFLRSLESTVDVPVDKFIAVIVKNKISSRKLRQVESKLKKTKWGVSKQKNIFRFFLEVSRSVFTFLIVKNS